MKLIILFLVGLALAGGSAWYLIYGVTISLEDRIIFVFPIAIGVFLMILSGTKGWRKINKYLDN